MYHLAYQHWSKIITKTCPVCVHSQYLSFLLKTDVSLKGQQGAHPKTHQKMPGIYQKLDFNLT